MIQLNKGDITGGLTAAVVALPLALALGVLSGMGAIAGLYGAIALGIVAAMFGGTPTQISGPTGPMTVVSAMVVADAIKLNGNLEQAMGMIIITFFLAGLIQVGFGLSKIGKYIKYIPYPVLSGFMTGIGVIIIMLQLFPLLGHVSPQSVWDVLANFDDPVQDISWASMFYATLTIALIYILPKFTKVLPSSLLALVIVSTLAYFAHIAVPTIGYIPHGLPSIQFKELLTFHLWEIPSVIRPALMLAALGAIDSLLTSTIADNLTKTRHDSNKELVGQGMGNMLSSLMGGLPGAGATMRTVVNIHAGATTKLSGVLHGLVLFTMVIGLGDIAAYIPLSVLAGILITVGISIIDFKGLKHLKQVPAADAAVMLTVLFLTIFLNLVLAVVIGLLLACVLFMKRMGDIAEERSKFETLAQYSEEYTWRDELDMPGSIADQVYIKHLYGPLFFGFVSQFQDLIKSIPDVKIVILRMDKVPYIDQSGIYAIEDAVLYLERRGIQVVFVGIESQPKDRLRRLRMIPDLIAESECFDNITDCFDWVKGQLQRQS